MGSILAVEEAAHEAMGSVLIVEEATPETLVLPASRESVLVPVGGENASGVDSSSTSLAEEIT